jgi:hypothetical protein
MVERVAGQLAVGRLAAARVVERVAGQLAVGRLATGRLVERRRIGTCG